MTPIDKIIERFEHENIGYVGQSTDFDSDAVEAFIRTSLETIRKETLEEIQGLSDEVIATLKNLSGMPEGYGMGVEEGQLRLMNILKSNA